jgi:enoyl-CoA hydratase
VNASSKTENTLFIHPSDAVRSAVVDGVLVVTIERPEKRNPLSLGVLEALRIAFVQHANDTKVRLAVISGSGDKAFASGGDLDELAVYRTKREAAGFSVFGKAALNAVRSFPVPVIARINGVALGGGAELALACDLRFAAAHAKIGLIHGRLKIAPSWGGGHDLLRLVGPARALTLLAEAKILDGPEAQSCGLFDAVCPRETEFESWFQARIRTLANNPPQVMRAFKSAARRMAARSEADAAETEHFSDVWIHDDHWAAVDEFQRRNK